MSFSYFDSSSLPIGIGKIKFTQFTATGTWTKDANAQQVLCIIWNGGAGGGSGRSGATTAAGGGGGGAAGNVMIYSNPANMFGTSTTITVGSGGAGGLAATSANGNPGSTTGTASLVGLIGPGVTTSAGATLAGGGGTTTNSAAAPLGYIFSSVPLSANSQTYGGQSIASMQSGFTAARGTNIVGESPANIGVVSASTFYWSSQYFPGYGAGGGGYDATTERSGGVGSAILYPDGSTMLAGGIAGLESTTINGGPGNNFAFPVSGAIFGGSGGGGAGGRKASSVGGTGGVGGIPGGGGGGGGGSVTAVASGPGGAGGRGEVWIYEFLAK